MTTKGESYDDKKGMNYDKKGMKSDKRGGTKDV